MDEKTEELRDIFMDVADDATVTERQEETHGSLTDTDDSSINERLESIIERMRERYTFSSGLSDTELRQIVRGFYEGKTDEELADSLGTSPETIFTARMDLHLIHDRDTDAPFELRTLRERLSDEESAEAIGSDLDVTESTVRHYRHVIKAQDEARSVSHRFQSEYEDVLTEVDLSIRLTESVQEDGLDEATEDIETDVSF